MPETITAVAENTSHLLPVSVPEDISVISTKAQKPHERTWRKDYLTKDKHLVLANNPNENVRNFYKAHFRFKNQVLDMSGIQMYLVYELMAYIDFLFTDYAQSHGVDFIYIHRFMVCKLVCFIDYVRKNAGIMSLTNLIASFETETSKTNMNCFVFSFREYLKAVGLISSTASFEDDDWPIDELFNVAEDRRSNGTRVAAYHFGRIENETSKKIIKEWIRFMVEATTLSVDGEIPKVLSAMTEFSNFIGSTSVLDATKEDCENYLRYLDEQDISRNTVSKRAYAVAGFYTHLVSLGKIKKAPLLQKDCPKWDYVHHDRTMPDSVLLQCMQHLDDMPVWALTIFLILCCTGARIGDVLSLKRGCQVTYNGHPYINISISKTKNFTKLLLSPEVNKIVSEYLEITKDQGSNADDYMFPAPRKKGWHISAAYFADEMKDFFRRNKIVAADGTIYKFESHGLRHRQATKIAQAGLSIFYVAKALIHRHVEMSECYVDEKIKMILPLRSFIDKNGLPAPMTSTPNIVSGDIASWAVEHENAVVVQDGVCARAVRFGNCANISEACITCDYYRTSPEYLPYHRERLAQLEKLREIAIARNSQMSLAKIDKEIMLRKKFIVQLEKMLEG